MVKKGMLKAKSNQMHIKKILKIKWKLKIWVIENIDSFVKGLECIEIREQAIFEKIIDENFPELKRVISTNI